MVNTILNDASNFHNVHSKQPNAPRLAKANPKHDSEIQAALTAISELGLKVERCGSWVWIFNVDESHHEQLKAANFRWSYRRGGWYFYPQYDVPQNPYQAKARPKKPPLYNIEQIRNKYGSGHLQV